MKKLMLLYTTITLFSFCTLSALIPATAKTVTTLPAAVAPKAATPAPKGTVTAKGIATVASAKAAPIAKVAAKGAIPAPKPSVVTPAPKIAVPAAKAPMPIPIPAPTPAPSPAAAKAFVPVAALTTITFNLPQQIKIHNMSKTTAIFTGYKLQYTRSDMIAKNGIPKPQISTVTADKPHSIKSNNGIQFFPPVSIATTTSVTCALKGLLSINIGSQTVTISPPWTGSINESDKIYITTNKSGTWKIATRAEIKAYKNKNTDASTKTDDKSPNKTTVKDLAASMINKSSATKKTNTAKKSKAAKSSKRAIKTTTVQQVA